MVHPGHLVGEALVGMGGQLRDYGAGQAALAHVGERLGVDHVVGVAGPQDLEEIQPALGRGGGERGEVVVAELGADGVPVPVSSTLIQAAVASPARSTLRASVRKASWPVFRSRTTCRLEIARPRLLSCATSRGTVT